MFSGKVKARLTKQNMFPLFVLLDAVSVGAVKYTEQQQQQQVVASRLRCCGRFSHDAEPSHRRTRFLIVGWELMHDLM